MSIIWREMSAKFRRSDALGTLTGSGAGACSSDQSFHLADDSHPDVVFDAEIELLCQVCMPVGGE